MKTFPIHSSTVCLLEAVAGISSGLQTQFQVSFIFAKKNQFVNFAKKNQFQPVS